MLTIFAVIFCPFNLGIVTCAIFTAVLILAPIILAQTRALSLPPRSALALLLATSFMSDSASLPLACDLAVVAKKQKLQD
ncbi:ArsB/NhaD family transporter [Campylobacter sp.]|uniref:ArsB/NhaD family transporter n=1 Tax=Campylobacter sp. TaxID=205 RepID=UPI002AA69A0F|nr:ArsB/NhaD family transporter [Campylobacter sp.]